MTILKGLAVGLSATTTYVVLKMKDKESNQLPFLAVATGSLLTTGYLVSSEGNRELLGKILSKTGKSVLK